eukprot:m.204170 g.204170  ORF g.204170 m.204170 type:complete len:373 (+) comp22431_c0_seq1:105-1223(+)
MVHPRCQVARWGLLARQAACRQFASSASSMRTGRACMPLAPSAADAIGNTPLVDCTRLVANSGVSGRVLAKLELCNPGGSKKDRIAKQIVDDALGDGVLHPGDTVVELTSGNTGTGLAIVCAARGLHFVAVMSEGNSAARAQMMRALGAEVVLVPQAPGSSPGNVSGTDLALVEEACRRIVDERGAFRADQFELEGSVTAHYHNTGPEIWSQSAGCMDVFVDFVGSAGTFAGCAKYFKEVSNGRVRFFIVEPQNAAVLKAEAAGLLPRDSNLSGAHPIQGGGYSKDSTELRFLAESAAAIDGYITVTDDEALDTARRLAAEEGIFGGPSGGANVAAALQLLRKEEWAGATVVAIVCDTGLKYLSTGLWDDAQ